jgi:hypothetical protein
MKLELLARCGRTRLVCADGMLRELIIVLRFVSKSQFLMDCEWLNLAFFFMFFYQSKGSMLLPYPFQSFLCVIVWYSCSVITSSFIPTVESIDSYFDMFRRFIMVFVESIGDTFMF